MRFLLLFVIALTCTFQNVLTDDNEGEDYDNFDYNKPRETSHDDETSRIGKASYDDETSLYGETSRYGETSPYEVAEQGEDRVFIGVNSVFEFIADPSNQSFFLLRMFGQWVSIMGGFILTHFMSWDYNDTQQGEEINLIKYFNFFTNPENAMTATTILVGHALCASLLFWLPTVFWRGEIPVTPTPINFVARSSESSAARCSNKRSLTDIQDSFPMSWRSMMSPHGIVRILIIMTMEHGGFLLFWFLAPFFTGSAFTPSSSSGRCIREAESSGNDLSDSESFILRSINSDPANFEDDNHFDSL